MLALWFSARKPRATVRTNRARKPRECVETHFLRRMRKENWEMRLRVCARKRFVCVYARNDAPLLKYTNSNGRPLARNEWYGVFVLSLSVFFNNRPSASRRALLRANARPSSLSRIRFRMRSCVYVYICASCVYDLYRFFFFVRWSAKRHARERN